MIPGVFPRLFSTYKEGAFVQAKFVVGGGGGVTATFALKTLSGVTTGTALANFNGLTLARTAVGIMTLTLRPQNVAGVRDLFVDCVRHVPATPGTVTNYYSVVVADDNEAAGTVTLRTINNTGATLSGGANELTLANGDEIHVLLYVNK